MRSGSTRLVFTCRCCRWALRKSAAQAVLRETGSSIFGAAGDDGGAQRARGLSRQFCARIVRCTTSKPLFLHPTAASASAFLMADGSASGGAAELEVELGFLEPLEAGARPALEAAAKQTKNK